MHKFFVYGHIILFIPFYRHRLKENRQTRFTSEIVYSALKLNLKDCLFTPQWWAFSASRNPLRPLTQTPFRDIIPREQKFDSFVKRSN